MCLVISHVELSFVVVAVFHRLLQCMLSLNKAYKHIILVIKSVVSIFKKLIALLIGIR